MRGRVLRTLASALACAALLGAALQPVAAAAAGSQELRSQKDLQRIERRLQRQGKMTQRVEIPKGADPRLLAERNYCGEALGSCWSTVGCILGYCLCTAERSCLRQQQ